MGITHVGGGETVQQDPGVIIAFDNQTQELYAPGTRQLDAGPGVFRTARVMSWGSRTDEAEGIPPDYRVVIDDVVAGGDITTTTYYKESGMVWRSTADYEDDGSGREFEFVPDSRRVEPTSLEELSDIFEAIRLAPFLPEHSRDKGRGGLAKFIAGVFRGLRQS